VFKSADDTKILRQVRDVQDNIHMQADLDKLVDWPNQWQMQFHVSKCKVMHVKSEKCYIFLIHEK